MDYLKIEQSSAHRLIVECQTRLLELIWERNNLPKQGRILDVGPGKGLYARLFRQWGLQVSCMDIDSSLRDFYTGLGCDFQQADLRTGKLPYNDGSLDLIWCSHVIEHLHNPVEFVMECKRILRVGGYLILRTPDLKRVGFDFWHDPTHVQPFIRLSLKKVLVVNGFSVVQCSNCELPDVRGLHRIRAHRWWPSLLFKGTNLIAVGRKDKSASESDSPSNDPVSPMPK